MAVLVEFRAVTYQIGGREILHDIDLCVEEGETVALLGRSGSGMANCTGACASYTPLAGDRFILRGGDTWTSTSMPWTWGSWAGTSGSFIYIGVDQTWFTGGSWARPIITCSQTCMKQFSFGTGSANYV